MLLGGALLVAVSVWRTFVSRTKNRKSLINVDDFWLDDTTRRVSWVKTVGALGVLFGGMVLMQRSIAGANVDTIYGIFMAAVVAPIVTRVIKGGDPTSTPTDKAQL
jgi:hypothetical protein